MTYFALSTGLRGCYMPDSVYVIGVKTRRELRRTIEDTANMLRHEGTVGLSRRAIASFAAQCWRDRKNLKWNLDYVLPYAEQRNAHKAFGIFISRSNRADYLAQE